jgi:hypothetical protein
MKKSRRAFTMILSILLSIAVMIFVVNKLEWQTVRDTFSDLNWIWLTAALLVFMINYILRTLRFQALIHTRPVSFSKLMGITCLHGMFNYLMPAKTGEFSYLFLLNRFLQVTVTESTATLFVARFFDFATIALFLPVVVAVFWEQLPSGISYIALIFCGIICAIGGGGIWLLRHGRVAETSPQDNRISNPWVARFVELWRDLVKGLCLIDKRGQYWRFLLLTIGIWLCVYTNFYFIVLSMEYSPSYLQMVAVSIIMVPLTLLPLQGFANIGTHEVGWVAAFTLFGQPQEVSLAIAASSHIILLLFILVIGTLGLVTLMVNSSTRSFSRRIRQADYEK